MLSRPVNVLVSPVKVCTVTLFKSEIVVRLNKHRYHSD